MHEVVQVDVEDPSSLVIAAQGGDQDAFGRIVLRFQNMAFAVAYAMLGDPHLAQDAAQEAFIDAYLSLPKLREPAAFPGWFRRVVIKHSDRQIRGNRIPTVPLDDSLAPVAGMLDTAALFEERQLKRNVHTAIAALPHSHRMVTTLFYLDEYSQKEISAMLDLPISTIKKQLYDARKKLKRRMLIMVQKELNENKPSQSKVFVSKLDFFIALKTGNLTQVETCLDHNPDLIEAQTEWGVASGGYYWPIGVTALYWAVGIGDEKLTKLLLSKGAKVNAVSTSGLTPLHFAVLMRRPKMVRLLLKAGAEVNTPNQSGHTPLHAAVMRDNVELTKLLLTHNAAPDTADKAGRTPLDWAVTMGRSQLVDLLSKSDPGVVAHSSETVQADSGQEMLAGAHLLGRAIDSQGRPLDSGLPFDQMLQPKTKSSSEKTESPILVTGIKIIDLLAPLKRGGVSGVFTPLPGIGKLVVLGQLIRHLAILRHGYTVCMGLEHGEFTAQSLLLAWRDWNVDQHTVLVFGHQDDSPAKRLELVESGLAMAENFRQQDRDVLLMVDSELALAEGALEFFKTHTPSSTQTAITTVLFGDHSAGALPEPLADLDAVITFDIGRGREGLWPAIDPLRSSSRALQLVSEHHAQIVTQVLHLLHRYLDLNVMVENRGLDALTEPRDRQSYLRARRLHRFLTQPMVGAELWTNIPGQIVALEDTLAGCQAILDGQYDHIPEEAFKFVGTIADVLEKAKTL